MQGRRLSVSAVDVARVLPGPQTSRGATAREGASRADEKIRFTCEHVNAHVLKSPAGDGQEEADAKSA
jgi:hypothetical protein